MSYKVKEIYYTLQGEGNHSGRPAVFLRFSGCNLWSGREEDRHKAICQFCDTDFWGVDGENGGKYTSAKSLVETVNALMPEGAYPKYVVCTGGEPMLQLDHALVNAFHDAGIEVGMETNGTIEVNLPVDWICMSPKENTEILQRSGHELKIVYPQGGMDPREWEELDYQYLYISPMDNDKQDENIQKCIDFCKENPKWRLSLQSHKFLDIK
ncbi:7-carboxy-7-deazaguanine synthase [Membranihabitans maritimus]|uniref:7-carboxy-7-deazaguanine synthase n=1 Tax=Membranihabitans maritimus TaxID=2904244 RepID=UPI001F01C48B|nr:7-carboxy-7-deazaguanine synthase [Membranihabitans maritimus]